MNRAPERRPIRRMAPELAQKIAAGEVVERPASAVKELLDNAVDAGASQIKVAVRGAGLESIRVSDNGIGIHPDDLLLAFASHATSKIQVWDDLEHLTTLGFRGEALAAIAAVSRIEIQTRAEGESVGARLVLEYGEAVQQSACSTPTGTRIAISDLFGNVPARRQFVRSLRAEGGQIQNVVMQYALAQPGIQFVLSLDGRNTFTSPGSGQLADALAAVHGPAVAGAVFELDWEEHGVRIQGLASRPEVNRPNRSAMSVFANGRPIQNRSLIFALDEAYSGFVMTGRHPVVAAHILVSPDAIDANIHPAKSEVRFARDREVHGALYRAAADALLRSRSGVRSSTEFSEPVATSEHAEPLLQPKLHDSFAAPLPDVNSALSPLPLLRVFGQANQTFIFAEGPDGVYMIDQHAAHERVLFDRLDSLMQSGGLQSQPLLDPETVGLSPGQMLALEENRMLLQSAGFTLDPFGTDACIVRAVPVLAGRSGPSELVDEVLSELERAPEPGAARERALAAMACKAAVKAGASLDVQEMRELVADLERTPRPATCPHGRPTMIHLSHSQLEREFGRR